MDDGYIYKSGDGGLTWTLQTAGTLFSTDVLDIHFADESIGYAVTESDVIIRTLDGGSIWSAVTGTGDSGSPNLTNVQVHDRYFLLVGTSNGKVYVSFDGATSWEERPFSGSGAGSVVRLRYLNKWQGALIHSPASGSDVIHTTIDGGYTWEPMTVVTNSGLNDLWWCNQYLLWAVGEAQGGTGVIIKATAG